MKKKLLCVFFIGIMMACSAPKMSKPRPYADWKNFEAHVSELKTAKAISEYMLHNLHYTSESNGERVKSRQHWYSWKHPIKTFLDTYGFCYDLAAFSLYALLKNEYSDAKLMFVCWGDWGNESNSGHFVSFFKEKENEKFYVINNGIYQGPFDDIEQVKHVAAGGRKILHARLFSFDEIPFRIRYTNMEYFCSDRL